MSAYSAKKRRETALLRKAGVTRSSAIHVGSDTRGADIASASTISVAAAGGMLAHVTGTTTINAIAEMPAGVVARLIFDDVLTITHNATSLILVNGANLVTTAGLLVEFISLGSGNWKQLGDTGSYQPLDATLTALAGLTISANSLILGTGADAFSVLAIGANTFPARSSTGNVLAKTITDFGLSLVDDADSATARATLSLVIGTNVQAWDADLDALAALSGTSTIYYRSGAATWTAVTIGGMLSFSGGTLNIGDAELTAIAGLTSAADKGIMFTGSGTAAVFSLTSAALTVLDDATVAAMVDTLGGASSTGTGGLARATSPIFVTPALGTPSSGNLANCTFPTLNQNTTGSAASLSVSGQTGLVTVTGLASTNRIKTVRDAADTILELGGSYTPTGTWTNMIFVTPTLGTPASGNLANCTFPTLNQNTTGSAASLSISGQTGLMTVTGLASTNRVKTVRDAADTILELGGSYTPTGTWTNMTFVTPALGTPSAIVLTNATGLPTAGVLDDAVTYAKMQNVSATSKVLGRKTAGAGDPEELSLSDVLDLIGSAAQGDILYRGASAWARLGTGTAGQILNSGGAGANPSWGSAAGGGTVTSVASADGSTTVTNATTTPDLAMNANWIAGNPLINGYLSASVAANALTIAIKNSTDGTDPSSTKPVKIAFRNATAATGDTTIITLTAATSLVISSGSTLGVGIANDPFRLWIVGFNDAGTFRIGAVNLSFGASYQTRRGLYDGMLASSSAEGGAGAADTAGTIYTGSAVTSKAIRILGYIEYSSGLATNGTYASAPTKIQGFHHGIPLPGAVIQTVRTSAEGLSGTTTIPADDTVPQNTEGTEFLSLSITPKDACNRLHIVTHLNLSLSIASAVVTSAVFRDSGAAAIAADSFNVIAINGFFANHIDFVYPASSASASTFTVRSGGSSASTTYLNSNSGGNYFGDVWSSFILIEEIMT